VRQASSASRVAAFAEAGWKVVAVSRRAPDLPSSPNWQHVPIDLLDAEACRRAVSAIGGVTHVVYAGFTRSRDSSKAGGTKSRWPSI